MLTTHTRVFAPVDVARAWSAIATLLNMEMQWWHTNDMAHPPSWQRMQIYPNPMLGSQKSARMLNSAGEEFFNQQQDDPLAFGPYTVQLKALVKNSSPAELSIRRSEEHTSELQSLTKLVCRLLLEKK